MIIGCVDNMDYVYGGARNANVKGGVDLVITSGHFKGVFGGNDTAGSIQGPITLTIEETGCDPLVIDNLYLGGKDAAYSIYGYKDVAGTLVARSSMSDGVPVDPPADDPESDKIIESQLYPDPVLNVVSCTSIGNVFGGGLGATATMYGSPTVNINMIKGNQAGETNKNLPKEYKDIPNITYLSDVDANTIKCNIKNEIGSIGNVYGGGSAASVVGDTRVNICTEASVAERSSMGLPITGSPKSVEGATITGNVFGAGLGLGTEVNNTEIVLAGGTVAKSVYGGGELGIVNGDTHITVHGGEIGDETGVKAGEEYGNVYGGGKGNTTHVRSGLIKGNTSITIEDVTANAAWVEAHPDAGKAVGDVLSSPKIYHNIYGGGAHGSVGTYTYASGADDAAISDYTSGGTATITITGGTIGVNGHENGMVFGSSRGEVGVPEAICDKLAWVYSTSVVIGTSGQGTIVTTPHIKGSVYGGGENGHVYQNASVAIHSGMVGITDPAIDGGAAYAYRGNVYGAGCGTDKYWVDANSDGNEDANEWHYNPKSGYVGGSASVTIDGGHVVRDVYGAGSMGSVEGSTNVTITGDAVIGANGSGGGYVFAAARGDHDFPTMATVGGTTLNISGGTIWMDAYGGGQNGYVKGDVAVNLTNGTVKRDVYGGGALAKTNTEYDANDDDKDDYITTVTLSGTTINGDLYGGGLGQLAIDPIAADVNGPVTVTVSNGKATRVFGCNNVNGSPKQTAAVTITGTSVVEGASAISSVYGGGNQAAYTGTGGVSVSMSGGTVDYVYGGGLGSTAIVNGSTSVTISGTSVIANDVYGGGSQADVTGSVNVLVTGGRIVNNVYGGGALASTNTANWEANKEVDPTYDEVSFLVVGESIVTGLYTRSGAGTNEDPYVYTSAPAGTAANGVKYYRQITGGWTGGTTSTGNTTTVKLAGGVMGNAYGGGLGDVNTPVYVYGDITVDVNKATDIPTGGTGAAFTRHLASEEVVVGGKKYNSIPITGSVFGCNDVNGTPRGDVTLTVYSTRQLDASENVISGHSPNASNSSYEIQAVYGGGNQADYQPAAGKASHVVIWGCDETSIEKVYGGGNSAAIPATDVVIWGSYDISDAFGGGNGSLPIKRNGVWIENAGSTVHGNTNISCKGGKIGNVFGGNDGKGNVEGTMNSEAKQDGEYCPLKITKIYGASNEADVDGDVNVIISGCTSDDKYAIEYVCGGSYNANIHGDITMTITSGIFKNVYGGNDARGSIGGDITVNIQEEDPCKPIIIQNLVGGGFAADYPGEDSKTGGNARRVQRNIDGTYKKDPLDDKKYLYEDFTSGKITINVKSATRIDNIYGGGFQAHVTGNTEVNVNMVKGLWAGAKAPEGYTSLPNVHQANYNKVLGLAVGTDISGSGYYEKNGSNYTATSDLAAVSGKTYYRNEANAYVIDDAIGTIGNIFGSGNEGNVYGNTVVNIGNLTNIGIMYRGGDGKFVTHNDVNGIQVVDETDASVLGANITGSVYGGGNLGDVGKYHVDGSGNYVVDVTGFTSVNIGAKESSTPGTYEAVAEGTEKVKIAGNVFGGGKGVVDNTFKCEKGMVLGKAATEEGTHVRIGNGTVGGNVYGGGEVGRVEWDTDVTIGYGDGVASPATPTSTPVIGHHVFGAGKGVNTHGYSALVRGNSTVTIQGNAKVGNAAGGGSVYGGGEYASVGKYSVGDDGMPHSLANNGSGYCTVTVKGYAEIGPDNMKMHNTTTNKPDFTGHVFGAGKGALPYEGFSSTTPDWHITETPWRVTVGNVKQYYNQQTFGDDYIDDYMQYIETLGLATQTYVTIGGHAFVKGSVYGGSENGQVQHDTQVTIQDYCQIGAGDINGVSQAKYAEAAFFDPTETDVTDENALAECNHWDYVPSDASPYDPFAKYLNSSKYYYDSGHTKTTWGGAPIAKDGHTFYGNVFGGGSGKDPYAPGEWHREAGSVGGNTEVNITGGHILTSVYGGNETTVVKGSCTITMSGGTLGVPRTLAQIAAHPVTCYLFGAGKGDQRIHFNTWANVANANVTISGGIIYGSTFGGGEDGHVLGNAVTNISGSAKIGTWGTSYVDGNVFGGGRGFSGEALTAGTVGGNVTVNISGGTMLGSIYGGGRLASVGTFFADPDNPIYGQLHEDGGGKTYGHITVNISGGTIGGGTEGSAADIDAGRSNISHSGNVYGGNMGRITLLNGSINPIWPELAQSKFSTVNISGDGTHITRNVYGGGEFGIVRENAFVTIGGTRNSDGTITPSGAPTIDGDVFGGGHGSDDYQHPTTVEVHWGGQTRYFTYTPMQWAGCVGGNTTVTLVNGSVKRIYGGGELASVGVIDYSVEEKADGEFNYMDKKYSYTNIKKHDSQDGDKKTFYDFGLSWPYEFTYVPCNLEGFIGGLATVNVNNGSVADYVYGGGQGKVAYGTKDGTIDDITKQRYAEAYCANVRETQVTIGTSGGSGATPTIGPGTANSGASVYGGGEDGHVYGDANVTIHHGTIVHTVFGGGKGTSTFKTNLLDTSTGNEKAAEDVCSWTAGKVYGNTSVTMNGGTVGWFIYGGGNMASVGKGNYSGGADDYSIEGYGETLTGNLWTSTFDAESPESDTNKKDYAWHFLNSGTATVNIYGGTVGATDAGFDPTDGIPYGSVFGGSRGRTAKSTSFSPRYKYVPDFFMGYVNKTKIKIGKTRDDFTGEGADAAYAAYTGPSIYGSVYGGGQDGHVRNSTEIKINKGSIPGQTGDELGRAGHVFGAGSGIGKYTDGENKYCNSSSGSVTCTTQIDIYGENSDNELTATTKIAGNVFGGGALASVGPETEEFNEFNNTATPYPRPENKTHGSQSYNKVTIDGGRIGGSVYGASRGPGSTMFPSTFSGIGTGTGQYDPTKFATSIWTQVDVKGGTILGSVYGGGEMGQVKESTVVNLTGGDIAHDAYGGGKGTVGTYAIAADVSGNTTVKLNEHWGSDDKGCSLERIFGCNDINGTPKGHPLVHVYATRHKAKTTIGDKYAKYEDATKMATSDYSTYLTGLATTYSVSIPAGYTTTMSSGTDEQKAAALENLRGLISDKKYDVLAVYGGGNLAKYHPTNADSNNPTLKAEARTEVIIDGCALTSIRQVYGGGNAAPVPATSLTVNAAYEIDEAFGGGNGKDNFSRQEGSPVKTVWYENPGANVGYETFRHYVKSDETGYNAATHGDGTSATPYIAIENDNATNKEYRQAYYKYGEGEAKTDIIGGRVHYVYGGSNQRGNISTLALSVYENSVDCPVVTDKTYGAGKNAEVDARTEVSMNCIEWAGTHFGGSTAADVNSDVVLNITNGHFGQIFGGNDTSGKIKGSITVNIQESSCKPIVIGELYGAGYKAGYSIYGYDGDTPRTKQQYENAVKEALEAAGNPVNENDKKEALLARDLYGYPKNNLRINVISATEIGTIFGGGYDALVVGSPYINVNMQNGIVSHEFVNSTLTPSEMDYSEGTHTKTATKDEPAFTYTVESILPTGDAKLAIGKIGNIYGGGNLADVIGNTNLEIGTGRWISTWDNSGNPVWETQDASGNKYTYREETAAKTYTQAECDAYNAELPGAIASGATLSEEQATAVNTALSLTGGDAYATDGTAVISTAHANAYNATLLGAINTYDIQTPAEWKWYDDAQNEVDAPTISARNAATITGNVFGGGKGEAYDENVARSFFCESAMVGADGDGLIDRNGGTTITIGNGKVGTFDASGNLIAGGNVYGGGEIGRVEKNTVVTIGLEGNTTNDITIGGNVFGAGKGVPTHGYSALVRGNSTVTIQGKAKVKGSVYGGGEIASVGRYNVVNGRPTSLMNPNSGNCVVTVRDYAEIGPDNMTMFHVDGDGHIVANDKPDNAGHVFGAGKGATPYIDENGDSWPEPWSINIDSNKDTYNAASYSGDADVADAEYLKFIETLALATQTKVTIGGNAWVKGDVFGGAEQGFVQHDTHVTIEGNCQIGNGYVQMDDDGNYLPNPYSLNRRYTDTEWADGRLYKDGESNYQHSLPECASWKYEAPYATHDMFANETGDLDKYPNGYPTRDGRRIATNGHTFYGNVFGGGSGYFPYKAGKWHWKAGEVGGNTLVEIKGGHILTNVYGGNEMTNVTGKSTINMSKGTIGVPRTLGQIMKHPVTCYLFGSGAGDQRVFFGKQTNVKDVEVNVTGGWIYGSVFGGGEDGHVLRDVTMNIGGTAVDGTKTDSEKYADLFAGLATKIGTWGTSYVDGNVFGGGRGFAGDAYTAGNVAGSVTMNITGGEMLGSIYGGGRLGSVGYGLFDEGVEGYGEMRADNAIEPGFSTAGFFSKGRGHVEVNITGGTIGNKYEFIMPTSGFESWTNEQWTTWKNENHVPNTEYDRSNGTLLHTKGGNVYAGGMGRFTKLDGTPISTYNAETGVLTSPIEWTKLGNVKSTKLTISGADTWIMGDVYGGGEFGKVNGHHTADDFSTEISITDATIGTEITGETPVKATIPLPEGYPASGNSAVKYTFGSVYGGGEGQETPDMSAAKDHGGEVTNSVKVVINGDTKVRASVFGGGEIASVGGNTDITISGGEIGRNEVYAADGPNPGYVKFGSSTMGNVYGAGKGSKDYVNAGIVKGNTTITIEETKADAAWVAANPEAGKSVGDVLNSPKIYHNIYGGGALASVGTFRLAREGTEGASDPAYIPSGIPYDWTANTGTATINITGGTIGISGRDNGMVNGSSRGDISTLANPAIDVDPYDKLAWVNNTIVNIGTDDGTKTNDTPKITGNIYGGGENGHNRADSRVNIYDGTIGVVSGYWATFKDGEGNDDVAKTREVNNSRGAVYGSGCGQDTYTCPTDSKDYYNPKGGSVFGNSYVTVKGGLIARNVYGGGSIASVGTITNDTIANKHTSETASFALSWPYKFDYLANTGVATVNIEGGHIGMGSERIVGLDNGNIYGGSKGDAGDRYKMAHIANVKESHVTINFTPANTESSAMLGNANYDKACIEGSVFGGGENGHVIGDTYVTLTNGFVSHSMFGGGRGEGKYRGKLIKVGTGPGYAGGPKPAAEYTNERDIYDWTAGKVYGNTHLTIVDGHILNNVLGGGYMASVGVGNYASGSDDYYSTGYGETLIEAAAEGDRTLWNKANANSLAFMNSGKTFVNVFGGKIGSTSLWDDLPAGSVFGGCRGMATPNLRESHRHLYNPQWLNGYTNETHVTIGGGYECKTACTDKNSKAHAVGEMLSLDELQDLFAGTAYLDANNMPVAANWTALSGDGPTIYGSVYGGAQDGRVRRDAFVTVNAGEIGLPYNPTYQTAMSTSDLDNAQWLHRGNVYGAGSGTSLYKFDVNDDGDTSDTGLTYYETTLDEEGYCQYAGCVIRFTNVNVLGGTIHRNVYGGGSMGSVGPPAIPPTRTDVAYMKGDATHGEGWQSQCNVIIGGAGPVTIGTPTDYQAHYGGEVYGASRGMSNLDLNSFSSCVWTKVLVKDGSHIQGNVFGGGDAGMVKKDTDVQIGGE